MASLKKRGKTYQAQWYVGGKQRRKSLETSSYQIAKERLRRLEESLAQGDDNPLPTKTPIGKVVGSYVEHIRTRKTPKSAQTDVYYLRQAFGPCCPEVEVTSRKVTTAAQKRPVRNDTQGRATAPIEAACFERITTGQISDFISRMVRAKGLAPKTANRYREILTRLFNWASREGGIRLPNSGNPAARVERYQERAPQIRYLTFSQIDEQLAALESEPQLRTMVAVYIYAGLRREEALWLQREDVRLRVDGSSMLSIRAKTINGESWQPKTRVNRAVPISRELARYLLAYRPRPSIGDWYFPSPKGTRLDPDNLSRWLRRAQKREGLVWGCLDYRHTFGSQLAQNGISLYKIATLMGNSPEICRRHYAAIIPEALVAEVRFESNDSSPHVRWESSVESFVTQSFTTPDCNQQPNRAFVQPKDTRKLGIS